MKWNFKWESESRFWAREDMERFTATNQMLQKLTKKIEFGNTETQPIHLMDKRITTDSRPIYNDSESVNDTCLPGRPYWVDEAQEVHLKSVNMENNNHFTNIETEYGLSRDLYIIPPLPHPSINAVKSIIYDCESIAGNFGWSPAKDSFEYTQIDEIHYLKVDGAYFECESSNNLYSGLNSQKADESTVDKSTELVLGNLPNSKLKNSKSITKSSNCQFSGSESRTDFPKKVNTNETTTVSIVCAGETIVPNHGFCFTKRPRNSSHSIIKKIIEESPINHSGPQDITLNIRKFNTGREGSKDDFVSYPTITSQKYLSKYCSQYVHYNYGVYLVKFTIGSESIKQIFHSNFNISETCKSNNRPSSLIAAGEPCNLKEEFLNCQLMLQTDFSYSKVVLHGLKIKEYTSVGTAEFGFNNKTRKCTDSSAMPKKNGMPTQKSGKGIFTGSKLNVRSSISFELKKSPIFAQLQHHGCDSFLAAKSILGCEVVSTKLRKLEGNLHGFQSLTEATLNHQQKFTHNPKYGD